MKIILQINSVVNSGSTGHIAEEIGQTAINQSWESYIACGRNERPSKSKLIKIGTDWDIKLHGIQTRVFDRHGFGSTKATVNLIKQINEIKPTIIHLHNLHGYYINIEVLFDYLRKTDIPVVWTLHDCWAFTGHCAHFTLINCNKWKTQCFKCPQKTSYPGSFLLDRSYTNYQQKKKLFTSVRNMTIVPVSQWLSSLVEQSYLSIYPKNVINNGVDINVFTPRKNTKAVREKFGIGFRYMLLGVATAWSKRKGMDDYSMLSEFLPDDCVIVLVGLKPSQIQTLPKKIIGIPRTENLTELAQLYSCADIVLNLSYEETFGLTTVEGFACGTPGIVYNCTASPELITPETGIIIEKGNIDGLVNAIKHIQKKGKAFYTRACVERARQFYNKDDRYKDYLNLYESILKKQNADDADLMDKR